MGKSSTISVPIGLISQNIEILDMPNIYFTLHQLFRVSKHLPYLKQLKPDIDLTDILHANGGIHRGCHDVCHTRREQVEEPRRIAVYLFCGHTNVMSSSAPCSAIWMGVARIWILPNDWIFSDILCLQGWLVWK
ncbi:hypothetical protein DL89DRAFT_265644 [Linderina pennispora]|uniref:Uncharacterized protein n=1 Tax=Linderina pennispora TaxID=61395 RepID=A0A1Y1WEM9_9FUNG|nr:uncharacterized protein DL89DRAFT_265644 [Linderina pennispora]ORX71932.1 hypothetical protein DL89DRAFT_265644 [Linderina pennispora]